MVYACDSCHFIFKRYSQTEQCPNCGKYDVRPATALEQEEFERRLKAQGIRRRPVEECKAAMDEAQAWAASVGYEEKGVDDIIKSVRQRKRV